MSKETEQLRKLMESVGRVSFDDTYKQVTENDDGEGVAVFEELAEELLDFAYRLQDAISTYAPDQLRYWDAYGIAHLKTIAGSDEYMSADESIMKLAMELEKRADDGREDEYEDDPDMDDEGKRINR